jgi:hypothetical protein
MILKFDQFRGKIKTDSLEKEEVIELVSLITELKPDIPSFYSRGDISKLIDNINYYTSDCGKYRISVYFRESDKYINSDGTITYGQFKSLYKITIKSDIDLNIGHLKEYTLLTSDIIQNVYPDSKIRIKFNKEKLSIEQFKEVDDITTIDQLVIIIRII